MIIDEYHKLEIGEIFERTRSLQNIRYQVATFIGTASITIMGFGFTEKKVSLIYLAAAIGLIILVVDRVIRSSLQELYNRGSTLESKYAPDSAEALLHKFSSAHPDKITWRSSVGGFWIPGIGILGEIILGTLLLILGWSLF